MIAAKVRLTQPLKAEGQFVGTTGSEHHIVLDDAAGRTGAKPIELVAVALSGCTAFDVITVLRQKYHQRVAAYEVQVEADQAERLPQVFTAVRIHHPGDGLQNWPLCGRASHAFVGGEVLFCRRNGETNSEFADNV